MSPTAMTSLAQLPLCTDVTGTVPVLTVLASGDFRFAATALSFATVRWRGYERSAVQIASAEHLKSLSMAAFPGCPERPFPSPVPS